MTATHRISPFIWFDGQAEEAAKLYVSVFPNSRVVSSSPLPSGPGEGSAVVQFELDGQPFTVLDGGPAYKITPAISFVISCDSQEEIDYYWSKLSEGGTPGPCGWLDDRFGVTWQVVPSMLDELLAGDSGAVMDALLTMKKIDIEALRVAAGLGS